MPLSPEGRMLRWGCACRQHPTILGVSNRRSSISSKAAGRPTIKSSQGVEEEQSLQPLHVVPRGSGTPQGRQMGWPRPIHQSSPSGWGRQDGLFGAWGYLSLLLTVSQQDGHIHLCFDTLHLPQQLQGFLQELSTEI